MLRYLYIPENEDLDEHIEYAINNNFNQIIHGNSDIIKDYLINLNCIEEINIPEYRMILNDNLVFTEKEIFQIIIIDEFIKKEEDIDLYIDIFRIDDNDLKKKVFIKKEKLNKLKDYVFTSSISLDLYGEYVVYIINNNKIVLEEKVIIYKEYKEKSYKNDKFFFE